MDRENFLNSFREALIGKVPDDIIRDNVNYYNEYINSQLQKGMSEAQVLDGLGDPRLLARTIEESTKFAQGAQDGDYREADAYETVRDEAQADRRHPLLSRVPTWLTAVILVIVVALMIVAVFSLLSYFAPLILFVLMIMMVSSVIRSWRGRY